MSSEAVIHTRGLSKCYALFDRPQDRLKQMFTFGRRRFYREFWAVKDVNLHIRKGETVGIIGRNGSGKSTLLQMLCGTLAPTSGEIEISGKVAALLELGAGFNPEFTGRENVFLNASIWGLERAEIERRFDKIAAFADIGEFIDQPLKTYSSGMSVRLAFAVAAHVDADLLIVDEALSVGDVFFAQKCMRFLREFREQGGTTLFVSHDTATVVSLCDRAMLMEQGVKKAEGDPEEICRYYIEQIYSERVRSNLFKEQNLDNMQMSHKAAEFMVGNNPSLGDRIREIWSHEQTENLIEVSPFNGSSPSMGLGGAQIVDAGFFDSNDNQVFSLKGGEEVRFSIFVVSKKRVTYPALGLVLKDRLGQYLFTEGSSWAFEKYYEQYNLEFREGDRVRVDFIFPMPVLAQGDYTITVAVAEGLGHEHVQHHLIHDAIALKSLSSRLAHGVFGFNSIKIKMTFSRQEVDRSVVAAREITTGK